MNLKKLERYLRVNLLWPGPRIIKKKKPGCGLTKVEKHLSSGSRVVPCGRTDMTMLIVAFSNFANEPNEVMRFFLVESTIICSCIWRSQSTGRYSCVRDQHTKSYVNHIKTSYRGFVLHLGIYRVSQEEWTKLREGVPYVKLYRYNPKHLYTKLNGYGDNGQRSLKLWQLLHTYWLPNTY